MSQLAASEGQPGNWEEPGFFLRRLETARFQEDGWHEPYESRGSRTVLWGVRREAHKVWWFEIATPAKFSQQPETEFCAVGGLSIQDGNKHCEA